jgi:hypothetical protein
MTKRRLFREPSLEKDLRSLLSKLCLEWGFCIPPDDVDRIACSQRLTADEFAAEVLKAEGFNPDYEVRWYRWIKRRFIETFGNVASADATSDPHFPMGFPASGRGRGPMRRRPRS